jgi:subtilase family serine protease
MRPWKFLLPLLATSLCFAAQPDRITTIDSSSRVALAKSHHPGAVSEYDQGPVDPSMRLGYITMLMSPSPTQQEALETLLAEQQDPKSPNYHKWLTPQQYAEKFGLNPEDLDKVTTWLKSEGFQIISVGGSRNSIAFSGTAAQAQKAFDTELHYYKVDGKTHFANATPLMIPAALTGIVRTVLGLHSFLPKPASQFMKSGSLRGSRPAYYDADFIFTNFLAPDDIATIYDITPLYNSSIDGTGQTLGIIGQTDVYLADINDFRSGFSLNPITGCTTDSAGLITACNSTYFRYVLVGTTDLGAPSTCGDLPEADLDIEWSGATARNAQIVYFNAPATFDAGCTVYTNGGGVDTALTAAIDPSSGPVLAHVLSMSYGICEVGADDLESVLAQANTEGITVVNSAGDQGSAACDGAPPNNAVDPPFSPAQFGLAVNYPASSQYVTGVGGTSISLANDSYPTQSSYWSTTEGTNLGTAVSYIPEQPWNDDEEFADYCHSPAGGDSFCSTGNGTPHWVALSTSATAAQVQSDIWISAGGGGASNCFYVNSSDVCLGAGAGPSGGGLARPSYQSSLSVSGAPSGVRLVPDVSLLASPDFPSYIYCTPIGQLENNSDTTSSCSGGIPNALNNGTYVSAVGGTSVSSPIFAGIVTLINESSGSNQGNINPTLYSLAATPANTIFHPVKTGDNNVYCTANTPTGGFPSNVLCPSSGVMGYSATKFDSATGYNLVNGLGSVDANALAQGFAPQFTLSTNQPTSASVPAGNPATYTIAIAPISGATPTVNFTPSSCSVITGVTCSFSPASVTLNGTASQNVTVTVSTAANMALASGTTITITPTGSSITTSVSLTVTATNQSFTIAPQNDTSTYSVTAGQAVPVNIVVSGTSPFINASSKTTALPLSYTVTGLPSEASYTVSPSQSDDSSLSPTLSITTTAATTQLRNPFDRHSGIFYAMLLPGVFGIVFAAGSRGRGARLLGLIVVLGLSTLWLGACGGSSNSSQKNPGTPSGSYKVTVTATTGAPTGGTALTSSFNITLTVQ